MLINFRFRFANFVISFVLLLALDVTLGDKDPLECQIVVDRGKGFTYCQFSTIVAADKDTKKIKANTTMFQGQLIERDRVTAVSFSFSDFDHIPSAIFTSFGDMIRVRFHGGKLKFIKKENFATAAHLRYFELLDEKVDEITSKAFSGAAEIEEITFENCEIGSIADDAFVGLTKLKKLRLTGSKYPNADFLKNLPKSVVTIEK